MIVPSMAAARVGGGREGRRGTTSWMSPRSGSGALTDVADVLDSGSGEFLVHFSCHGSPGDLELPRGLEWARR